MPAFFRKPQLMAPALLALALTLTPAQAHHSFAMYDKDQSLTLTGVVTRVSPDPAHLTIYFVPLDDARETVMRDDSGEPEEWVVEMIGAAIVASQGVTVNSFPRGTIISVGLHPLRNGRPGGARGDWGLWKCPENSPPAAGLHCDSVDGATQHGPGELPAAGEEH